MTLWKSRLVAAMMAVLSILPGLCLIGCEGDSSGSAAESFGPVVLDPSTTLAFYGRAYDWLWVEETVMREEIKALAENGWDGYLIELGASAGLGDVTEAEARERIAERYPMMVDACADEGLFLFVGGVQNDNAGEGKYLSNEPPLSEQTEHSAWLVNLIAAVGRPDVVMVQPCSETKTQAGRDLERLCAQVLTNFTLVSNPNKGEVSADGGKWADYEAMHPWSIDDIVKADIIVGDTSGQIKELDLDGDMDGPCSPSSVYKFLKKCESVGAMLAGVYVFDFLGPVDYATIEALGK